MPRRIMFWVGNIADLAAIKNLGCDGVHHAGFDGISAEQQAAWMAECGRLGLQIGWSALGGTEYARQNREATIKRWKDSPLVSHVIIVGDAQTVAKEAQIAKYNQFKSWAPNILFGIDREFWFTRNGNWSEEAFDILFPYSYPYQTKYSVDSVYDHIINSMNYLIKGTYPIIPLIQCFNNGNTFNPRERFQPGDPEYSKNYIKAQYDRLKALLQPKGWWSDSIGFYPWQAGYGNDVRRSSVMQAETKELNTGEGPEEIITDKTILHGCNSRIFYRVSSFLHNNNPLSCPNCGLSLGPEGIPGSEEIVDGPEPKLFYASASGTVKGDGTITPGTLAIEPQTREEWKRRGFVSFDTSPIPEDAIIDEAYLRVYPFDSTYGGHFIRVDYCLYGTLDAADLNRTAEAENIAEINATNIKGQWVESGKFVNINKGGLSQYRLVGTEYTKGTTWLRGANTAEKPELHVAYHLPEETTKVFITCPACRSKLELTVSSVASKNIRQYCPICGEPAD